MKGREISQNLLWAADGAKVLKTCDVDCFVTHDQSLVPRADAVIMEVLFIFILIINYFIYHYLFIFFYSFFIHFLLN